MTQSTGKAGIDNSKFNSSTCQLVQLLEAQAQAAVCVPGTSEILPVLEGMSRWHMRLLIQTESIIHINSLLWFSPFRQNFGS